MTPAYALVHILPAAFALLPAKMDTPQARAMLLAVGLQESGFRHRRQIEGPARGFWQFEQRGGVAGVLTHAHTAEIARDVCGLLGYQTSGAVSARGAVVYAALADNDILACAFARLLLWTLPEALPGRDAPDTGWAQYLKAWRPGKPRKDSWNGYWETAWLMVDPAGA